MIHFATPEAFLLVPLAVLLLRRRLWTRPFVGTLRVLLLLAIAALLAQPWLPGAVEGRDVVIVLDRSRSMPAQGGAEARELATQLSERLLPGDRIGLVTFGTKAAIEVVPESPFAWREGTNVVVPDGSDLAAAVTAGLSLVAPGRHGSLLVLSDGEHTGGDLEAAARAALRTGIRIDTQLVARAVGADVAVADILAPNAVTVGQPFAVTAVVIAKEAGPAHWRLLADGDVMREGDAELREGRNVLQFRRTLSKPGLQQIAIEVTRPGDAVPQNDRGLTVVRGIASPRVLCVTPGGREDRLTNSLRAAGLDVEVQRPQTAPLTLDGLDSFRCVVLEDVPASDLPTRALASLAVWVKDLGGGLLMTGGKASYGVGGYHRSAVESVLPVTMEMREEQRRFGLAMAIALDRSGSMAVSVGDTTKMQLADRGAATAVEMLSPIDAVSVIAVDSAAHVVVPMQPVNDSKSISAQVRSIESMGGGIYVGAALHAAAEQLVKSSQQNRHIVLFADAADAEEPGDYRTFVPELVKAGVTISVIGLGSPADSDANLLEEIAKLGGGRCHFVADPADLPRVFARETIQVARSAMIEEPTAVQVLPALGTLGDMPVAFPQVGGYSLAWPRPRAERDLITQDEQKAPMLSHWQVGLGRSAAFLGEVDGATTGGLAAWDGYGDFFATLVRWLCGGQERGIFLDASRTGSMGQVTLEVEDDLAAQLDTARGVVTFPDGRAQDLVFERAAAGRLTAQLPLEVEGVYRAAVQVGGVTLRVPPLCLPYSPEYAPQPDARAGERTLRRLATTTGGRMQPTAEQVLEGARKSLGRIELGLWCALAALVLLLAEICVRRFAVQWPSWRKSVEVVAVGEHVPQVVKLPNKQKSAKAIPVAAPTATPQQTAPPQTAQKREDDGGTLGALSRAKKRSEGR